MDLNRSMLGGITRIGGISKMFINLKLLAVKKQWQMTTGKITDKKEDLTWLL